MHNTSHHITSHHINSLFGGGTHHITPHLICVCDQVKVVREGTEEAELFFHLLLDEPDAEIEGAGEAAPAQQQQQQGGNPNGGSASSQQGGAASYGLVQVRATQLH
jgi:hypothetical protein